MYHPSQNEASATPSTTATTTTATMSSSDFGCPYIERTGHRTAHKMYQFRSDLCSRYSTSFILSERIKTTTTISKVCHHPTYARRTAPNEALLLELPSFCLSLCPDFARSTVACCLLRPVRNDLRTAATRVERHMSIWGECTSKRIM